MVLSSKHLYSVLSECLSVFVSVSTGGPDDRDSKPGPSITCFPNGLVYVLVSCLHKQTNKQAEEENAGLASTHPHS